MATRLILDQKSSGSKPDRTTENQSLTNYFVGDEERNLSPWLGNELQQEAFENLYKLSDRIDQCSDPDLLKDWQYLQTSDHFYYMNTEYFSDGNINDYFNPYESPYEAFMNYMNVLNDYSIRLNQKC